MLIRMNRPIAHDAPTTRVLFAAGSGDVAGTLLRWHRSEPDTRIMAEAYSAQIYDIARERAWTLLAQPNHPCPAVVRAGIAVHPLPKRPARGWRYLAEEVRYGLALAAAARRFDADLLIVATGIHPLGHLALCTARRPVVLSLHNTFWTRGTAPPRLHHRPGLHLPARLLRLGVRAAVCVSEEIHRQVVHLRILDPVRVAVFIPQYRLEALPWSDPPTREPRQLLFAGRIEHHKGVEDILLAARTLESERPGRYHWRIAGDGPHLEHAKAVAHRLGLDAAIRFLGRLDRDALAAEINDCFATLTPTRTSFREGLAKLPLEGAACGRPAIVSTAVPAADLLADAAEPVRPSEPEDIARAVRALDDQPDHYRHRHHACRRVRELISNPALGYRARVAEAADTALKPRTRPTRPR
tara:strand:+ start:624 stop:1859 length:1236 start_codon:yes stop_codon:yes gene_type:complete